MDVAFSPDGRRLASAELRPDGEGLGRGDRPGGPHPQGPHRSRSAAWPSAPTAGASPPPACDRTVKVWDAATGQEVLTLQGTPGVVWSVAFSPDGRRIASAERATRTVKVWDAATRPGDPHPQGAHRRGLERGVQPRRRRIASASGDRTVKVWDAATGQEVLTLKGHTELGHSVAFSPDGRRIASASTDKTVKVWDAATGQEVLTLNGHTRCRLQRGVQPRRQAHRLRQRRQDGEGVGRGDRAGGPHPQRAHGLRLQRGVQPRRQTHRLRQRRPDGEGVGRGDRPGGPHPQGHTDWVCSVAFSPDGKRIASAARTRR